MKLPSEIRFIDENIQNSLYKLEKGDNSERELYKFINQALNNIDENAFCGIQIPKKLIPKEYILKYNVKNLWKQSKILKIFGVPKIYDFCAYDLPKGWRLIYSIINDQIVVVSLVLEWFDHKDYERRFNY